MKNRVLIVMLLQSLGLEAMQKNENLTQIPESYQSMENFKDIKSKHNKDQVWDVIPLDQERSDDEELSHIDQEHTHIIYSSKKNKSECCCFYFFRKKRDNGNLLKR